MRTLSALMMMVAAIGLVGCGDEPNTPNTPADSELAKSEKQRITSPAVPRPSSRS